MIFKLLKRFALILLMAFVFTQTSSAQLISDLIFSASVGTFVEESGGSILFEVPEGWGYTNYWVSTDIGFPFTFDGVSYTQCNAATCAGWITFQPPYTYSGFVGNFATALNSYNPAIYPYGGYFGMVSYAPWGYTPPGRCTRTVSGSAPYRVCTFQWNNIFGWIDWGPGPAEQWEYQVKLYETINKIEIVFGPRAWTNGGFFAGVSGLGGQIGSNRWSNVNPDGSGGYTAVTNNTGQLFNTYAKFLAITEGLTFKWARPEITLTYPLDNTGYPRNVVVAAFGNIGVKINRPAGLNHYVQYEIKGPLESLPNQIVYTAWNSSNQPNITLPANCNTDPGGNPDFFFTNATGPYANNPGSSGDFFTGPTAGTFKATGRMYESPPSNLLLSTKQSQFSVLFDNDLAVMDIIVPLKKDDQLYPIQSLPISVRVQNRGMNDIVSFTLQAKIYDKNHNYLTSVPATPKEYDLSTPLHTLDTKVCGDLGLFDPTAFWQGAGNYYIVVTGTLIGPTDQLLSNNVLPRVGDPDWNFYCAYEVDLEATTIIMPSNYDFYNPPNMLQLYVNKPYRPQGFVTNWGVSDVMGTAYMYIIKAPADTVYADTTEITNAPSGKYNTTIVTFDKDWVPQQAGNYTVVFTVYNKNDAVPSNNTKIDNVTVIEGMCGTYTIGMGGNYATIGDAADDLYTKGVSCPVTFYLTDTYYLNGDFNSALPAIDLSSEITGMSEINTVSFKPSPIKANERGGINSGVTIELRSGTGIGVLMGQNAYPTHLYAAVNTVTNNGKRYYSNPEGYLIFDGGSNKSIRFVVNMTYPFQSAFYLKQGSVHNTIKNCIFENSSSLYSTNCSIPRVGFTGNSFIFDADYRPLDGLAYSAAIVMRSKPEADLTGNNPLHLDTIPCVNNTIMNNEISGYGLGIVDLGIGALWNTGADMFKSYYNSNNEITDNIIYNVSRAGIFAGFEDSSKILHNRIYDVTGTCSDNAAGIIAGGDDPGTLSSNMFGYNNANLIIGENEINYVYGSNNVAYNYPAVYGIKVQQSRNAYQLPSSGSIYFPEVNENMLIRNNTIWALKANNDKTSRFGIRLFTERMPVADIPSWDNGFMTLTASTSNDITKPDYFSRNDKIYNNTVFIEDDAVSSRGALMGIVAQHTDGLKIYNNAVTITDSLIDGTSPAHAAIFYEGLKPDQKVGVFSSDRNALWIPPSSQASTFGFIETDKLGKVLDNTPADMAPDAYSTLRQWYFWTGQDESSVFDNFIPDFNYNPLTMNPGDKLRIRTNPTPTGSSLNNRGFRLPDDVPIDIDGQGRTSGQLYDIGADEFDGILWLSDLELCLISAPGAYKTNIMPLAGFGDAEHIMTEAPIDVKVLIRNNGNNHASGVDVNLKIYIESASGLWIEDFAHLVIDTTIKVDLLSGLTSEFSFHLADGMGTDFYPQTYSELPSYQVYDRFKSMLGNVTPRYKMMVHIGADQKNSNNDKEIITRFYLKQSHTLNMMVSAENSYQKLWLTDNFGISRIASQVDPSATFSTEQLAGALNYQYLTGESSTITHQTGLEGVGWYTNLYRDDPPDNMYKIDVLDRAGWEPKTVDYTLYRSLFWSDGNDKPTARFERMSIANFLIHPKFTEAKQNLFIASQEMVRELTGYGLNPPANDPSNPIDTDFVYTYLRARTNASPWNNPMYIRFNYLGTIPPIYGVKGTNVGRDLIHFITSTHNISLSYSADANPMTAVLSVYPSGEGLARTAYNYVYQFGAPLPPNYNNAPFGVATTTLDRNVIIYGADWRHFNNTELVLRAMLDFAEKNGGAIIPVELVNFDAVARGKNVDINWSTASEYKTDRFEIERATLNESGKSLFNRITDVKAAGTSSDLKNYGYVDANVDFGKTYFYRLRTVDLDGKSTLSDERKVEIGGNGVWFGDAMPNPASDKVLFDYTGNTSNLVLVVFDDNGKSFAPSYQIKANEIELNLSAIASGSYTLVVKSGDSMMRKQFTVVK